MQVVSIVIEKEPLQSYRKPIAGVNSVLKVEVDGLSAFNQLVSEVEPSHNMPKKFNPASEMIEAALSEVFLGLDNSL